MSKRGQPRPALAPRRNTGPGVTFAALGLLTLAALVAYHNSLDGPFVFDDVPSIVENPDIRQLATTLRENSHASTFLGRPLLGLSLWLNYAWGGEDVRGYHVVNLLLHILTAWTLWGLARKVLEGPRLRESYGKQAGWLALAIALIWTVHPLQTESVSYLAQRAEILGAVFYLLTLYSVVRVAGAVDWHTSAWSVAAVAFCLLGMASKETVSTAPLVALLLDRVFLAPSWRALWRARKALYVALACCWIFLAVLMATSAKRMGTAGFGLGMTWWEYARTQPYYVFRYLLLSVWPRALTLDYGSYLARTPGEVVPYAAIVLLLMVLTLVALWRKPPLGFCGAWFFVILAPTSSVVPIITQTGAEHRMYLPLVGLIAPLVLGSYELWHRVSGPLGRPRAAPVLVVALLVTALGARTIARNADYRSPLAIWATVVERWPTNPRAHLNLGNALASADRLPEAIAQYESALLLEPDRAEAHLNLGNALVGMGRLPEAIGQFEEAVRLKPDYTGAHLNLGDALASAGRLPEAIRHFDEAVRLKPDLAAGIHVDLGRALASAGRLEEAIGQYEEALRLQPDLAIAHVNLGNALARMGRLSEAIDQYQTALRLQPDLAEGRLPQAIAQLEEEQHLSQPQHRSDASGGAGGSTER
jgi:Flp pilus assembly protein TadD